jgi:hypothetical protein
MFLLLAFQPPTFGPDNPEGLKMSPNPRIRYSFKRQVFWKEAYRNPSPGIKPPVTAAERQSMIQMLETLTGYLKATPNGSRGEGFWVNDSRTVAYFDLTDSPLAKPVAEYSSGLFPFYHEDYLQDNGTWTLSRKGETESVYFYFNQLPGRVDTPVLAIEARRPDQTPIEFYTHPVQTASWQGYPVYDNRILVVTRPGRSPWAPVAIGRVLKAAFSKYEEDKKTAENRLAGLKKENERVQSPAFEQESWDYFEKNNAALKTTRPSNYNTRKASAEREIRYTREKAAAEANPQRNDEGSWYWNPIAAYEQMVARFAALTPEQMQQPACFLPAASEKGRYQMRGDIVPFVGQPGCTPIVETNWNYFDPALPRVAPQILTIRDFGRCVKVDGAQLTSARISWDYPPQGCVQHAQMWRELDWPKLQGLLTR